MSRDLHLVVIGGGVIGSCAAWYCRQAGWRVTVLERRGEQHQGCSFGNAGMIVPSHFVPLAAPGMVALGLRWMWNPESPFYVQPRLSWELCQWGWRFWRAANARHVNRAAPILRDLHLASRTAFEALADQWGESFDLQRRGLLMLCHTQHGLDEEARFAEHARRLGIPAELLTPQQAATIDPGLAMDIRGAVLFPRDCHLHPGRFMEELRRRTRAAGVNWSFDCEATGLEVRGRRIHAVRGSHGDIEADAVLLAAGSWSPSLARQLRLRLPMQPGKGYSLTLPAPPRLPQLCSILTEARVAVTPLAPALRFGGTMELAGWNESLNERRVRGIVRAACRYYPEFAESDFAAVAPWCGLRPCSPDGLPYLGRPARYDNLLIATGHAMMGLSLAPISGQIIARLLADEPPGFDLGPLQPDRYGDNSK